MTRAFAGRNGLLFLYLIVNLILHLNLVLIPFIHFIGYVRLSWNGMFKGGLFSMIESSVFFLHDFVTGAEGNVAGLVLRKPKGMRFILWSKIVLNWLINI